MSTDQSTNEQVIAAAVKRGWRIVEDCNVNSKAKVWYPYAPGHINAPATWSRAQVAQFILDNDRDTEPPPTPNTTAPCSPFLREKLLELRKVAAEAQELAQSADHYHSLELVLALDPVVNGSHAALKTVGIGYMEYKPCR